MSARILDRESELSTLRQLRILVVLLILSNIALGFLGFYCLRAVDEKYSSLIDQSVPTLSKLQTLTALTMKAMRSTNPDLLGGSPQDRGEMLERAKADLKRDRAARDRVLRQKWVSANTEERENFQSAGEAFSEEAGQVVGLFEADKSAEAIRHREQVVRPAFERYVAATTKVSDVLESQSLRTSSSLTTRSGHLSNMLLGMASWPVILLCLFLLITAAIVVGILLWVVVFKPEAAA
jgi:hypothetical protein